jgi:hypothetical protein
VQKAGNTNLAMLMPMINLWLDLQAQYLAISNSKACAEKA